MEARTHLYGGVIYSLKFFFRGLQEPVVWTVSYQTMERVTHALGETNTGSFFDRVEFDTTDDRVVIVNTDYIVLLQALVDYGRLAPQEQAEDDMPSTATLMIEGFPEAVEFYDMAPAALHDLAFAVREDTGEVFVSFLDDDGEPNYLQRDSIIYMEHEPIATDDEE